jgi:hypothetical protein
MQQILLQRLPMVIAARTVVPGPAQSAAADRTNLTYKASLRLLRPTLSKKELR